MAKRKISKNYNIPINLYLDGDSLGNMVGSSVDNGGNKKPFNFEDFINSEYFQNAQKVATLTNLGASSAKGQPSFLSMSNTKGSGLYGTIGQGVNTIGQTLSAIDTMLTKKRKPLEQTVGLVSWDGKKQYAGGGPIGASGYMEMGTTALELAGNAIQQAQIEDTSNLEDQIKSYSNTQLASSNFDDLMNEWSSRTELQHISARDLRNKTLFGDFANSLSASGKGFAAGSNAGPWGAVAGGIIGGVSSVVGSLFGRSKAKKKAAEINKKIDIANTRNLQAYTDKAANIDTNNDLNILSNFSAFGGPINMYENYGISPMGYDLASKYLDTKYIGALSKNNITSLPNSFSNFELKTFADGGSIHINPSKRGTFTAAAKRHGKGVQEFARQVLANKENYSPAMVKKANFARNVASWKHSDGGSLISNGVKWDNGLTYINNGNTHENNIYEGVPVGIDNQGIPNLVEEGEVIWNNDYVFSNRLTVPKAIRSKYKLRGNKELTFADAAKKMAKESEERPNDPISKRGLMDSMSKLQQAQETVRQQTQEGQEGVQYAHGGRMGTLFDGTGDKPNIMARAKDKRVGYDVGDSLEDYFEDPVYENEDTNKGFDLTQLRYAPVVGSALGVAQNLFSSPDYTNANAILDAANKVGNYLPVSYKPIGNYLTYTPLDRNYYINKLDAQAGATRRAIMNTTSPSREAALLAADYNAQGRLGDLMRQAEEYNLAQRQAVEEFNRGTNMTNSEMGLRAAMANQSTRQQAMNAKLNGIIRGRTMREAIDEKRSASLSSNLSNLFENLGNIGIDEYNKEDRDKLIRAGVFGTLSEKPQEWSNKRWEDYKKAVSGTGYRNEGKLKKKKGGFTY